MRQVAPLADLRQDRHVRSLVAGVLLLVACRSKGTPPLSPEITVLECGKQPLPGQECSGALRDFLASRPHRVRLISVTQVMEPSPVAVEHQRMLIVTTTANDDRYPRCDTLTITPEECHPGTDADDPSGCARAMRTAAQLDDVIQWVGLVQSSPEKRTTGRLIAIRRR
jgi:hypothetical protein